MSLLTLTPRGFKQVQSGAQRSTTRRGFRTEYTLGDAVFVCGEDRIPIIILKIEALFFDELCLAHARHEGLKTVSELKKKVRTHYPELSGTDWVTHVVFILKGEEIPLSQAV